MEYPTAQASPDASIVDARNRPFSLPANGWRRAIGATLRLVRSADPRGSQVGCQVLLGRVPADFQVGFGEERKGIVEAEAAAGIRKSGLKPSADERWVPRYAPHPPAMHMLEALDEDLTTMRAARITHPTSGPTGEGGFGEPPLRG
jgi:hypothetical protein